MNPNEDQQLTETPPHDAPPSVFTTEVLAVADGYEMHFYSPHPPHAYLVTVQVSIEEFLGMEAEG